MKPIIYTLAVILGLATCSTIQASSIQELDAAKPTGNQSNNNSRPDRTRPEDRSPHYAFYFSDEAQIGIGPNHIVALTNLGRNNSNHFELTSNGGFTVPKTGSYLVSYRVLANTQASLALFKNGILIPETAFSNTSTSPIFGSVIIAIHKNDVITIQSIETVKTINTVVSVSTTTPSIPVSLTVQNFD